MFILLHFGKGKTDERSLTGECWKAPQLTQVPFSFECALENLLVYMKNKQAPLDSARGETLWGHLGRSLWQQGCQCGEERAGQNKPHSWKWGLSR